MFGNVRKVAATTCIACGVICLVVFSRQPEVGRVSFFERAFIVWVFWGPGIVLLAVPAIRRAYSPTELSLGESLGCLFFVLGGFAAFFITGCFLGD
jgi:hypothetical protein